MPNAITYCRVSSEEQALKDISIPAQRKAIHRWADQQPGLVVLQDFVDEGQSAYAPADKRPGFCEMVAFCRKHDVDLILVHKLDRFSRNREESILFKSLLRRHGVTVKSITENYDPETPQGFLYEGMIEVINQFYSMNLATETLKGMRENAERGYHNGGRVPYGYRLAKVTEGSREHSRLVPGPDEEVAVVREVFRLATDHGLGVKAIANELNRRGVRGPCSEHWNSSTINHMLSNRVYVGDQVWFRSKKAGRDGREATDKDQWIVTEDAHEPLVDREVFQRRQEIAASRQFMQHRSPRRHVSYLLSRLMVCGQCGAHFHGRRHKYTSRKTGEVTIRHRYYCGSYLSKGPAVCPPLAVDRDWAENLVLATIRARLCSEGGLEELEAKVRDRVDARRKVYGEDTRAITAKLAEVDRRIANYYRAIGDGLDPLVCQRHIAELTQKKEQLEEEAAVLQQQDYYDRAREKNLAALRRFAGLLQEGGDNLPFAIKRQVVLQFIKRIEVVDRERLVITMKVPLDNAGIKLLTDELEATLQADVEVAADSLQSGAARGAILGRVGTPTPRPFPFGSSRQTCLRTPVSGCVAPRPRWPPCAGGGPGRAAGRPRVTAGAIPARIAPPGPGIAPPVTGIAPRGPRTRTAPPSWTWRDPRTHGPAAGPPCGGTWSGRGTSPAASRPAAWTTPPTLPPARA